MNIGWELLFSPCPLSERREGPLNFFPFSSNVKLFWLLLAWGHFPNREEEWIWDTMLADAGRGHICERMNIYRPRMLSPPLNLTFIHFGAPVGAK